MAGPRRRTGLAMAILPAVEAYRCDDPRPRPGGSGPASHDPACLSAAACRAPFRLRGGRITGTGATGAAFPTILSCWGSARITEAAPK